MRLWLLWVACVVVFVPLITASTDVGTTTAAAKTSTTAASANVTTTAAAPKTGTCVSPLKCDDGGRCCDVEKSFCCAEPRHGKNCSSVCDGDESGRCCAASRCCVAVNMDPKSGKKPFFIILCVPVALCALLACYSCRHKLKKQKPANRNNDIFLDDDGDDQPADSHLTCGVTCADERKQPLDDQNAVTSSNHSPGTSTPMPPFSIPNKSF